MKSEILVSITGRTPKDWKSKLAEIEKLKIKRIALFVTFYNKKQREELYQALLKSSIKQIPFIHTRTDSDLEEYKFLMKNFHTKYFNLHIDCFELADTTLKSIRKKILFEHKYSNSIKEKLDMNKIGGFCIDLSHFKSAKERGANEFEFVMSHKKNKKLFIANHLNGYSPSKKQDMHTVRSNKDFVYLKNLPKFIFGKYIALETFNSIKEQLEFKEYLRPILEKKIKLK